MIHNSRSYEEDDFLHHTSPDCLRILAHGELSITDSRCRIAGTCGRLQSWENLHRSMSYILNKWIHLIIKFASFTCWLTLAVPKIPNVTSKKSIDFVDWLRHMRCIRNLNKILLKRTYMTLNMTTWTSPNCAERTHTSSMYNDSSYCPCCQTVKTTNPQSASE